MDKKKIYWFLGASGLILGVTIGRYVYLNKAEVKEAQENFNPNVIDEITNNHAETLDETTLQDSQISKELMEAEILSGDGDY